MITDELREWMENAYTYGPFVGGEFPKKYAAPWFGWEPAIVELLDRIDERHERDLRESYDCGYASADDWLVQHEDAMAEHGWVRLPVDADGVPIRVGDVMEFLGGMTVSAIGKDDVYFFADNYSDGVYTEAGFHLRHHHAPTVEDVLLDLLEEHSAPTCDATPSELAEKYAAKLRLAGDE